MKRVILAERGTRSGGNGRGHAVVIGGGMAGLLSARVLSDHFGNVTIVERDRFPEGVEGRKGVPQGRHLHALLPRGQEVLEELFPGLAEDLISTGAIPCDVPAESSWFRAGGYRVRYATGRNGLLMSRPFLEGGVRRRVRALSNVGFLPRHAVTGLVSNADRNRVIGVTVRLRAMDAPIEEIRADLVVDACGRGSRAPAWLEGMGYERPAEEKIGIGVGYTTRLYRRRPDDLPGTKLAVVQATPPDDRRFGVILRVEGGRWLVTLGGYLGERAPTDEAGFVEYARSLPAPEIYDTIKDAESLGGAARFDFPANLRRRYERLGRLPGGYLVTGDALCSFNPAYGQGMTVAALETKALDACLREGREQLPRRFYRRASKVLDTPWRLTAGADLAHPGATGRRTRASKIFRWYLGHVLRTATWDERVCRALSEVTGLVAPPGVLFRPPILWRVMAGRGPHRPPDSKGASGRTIHAGTRGVEPVKPRNRGSSPWN